MIGNGVPDWKVGEAPPAEPESRGLGILATTVAAYRPEYGGIRPHCSYEGQLLQGAGEFSHGSDGFNGWIPRPELVTGARFCRADQLTSGNQPRLDGDGPIRTRESGVQLGPSWALNAIDMLDEENVGYAVGDRGAILRFGSSPAEADPPALGARRPTPLADRSPYAETTPPLATETGTVPPLATQPREQTEDPQLVRAGSPDGNEIGKDLPGEAATKIVMSRDGSEGWAIGPAETRVKSLGQKGVMTLYHYEAGQWTRCDPDGVPGIAEPDPACADLRELYHHRDAQGNRIRLQAAARIPREYDSDPLNDDEFEMLVVGSPLEPATPKHNPVPTVLRYSEGRWRLDDLQSRISLNHPMTGGTILNASSLACTGADECWLAGKRGGVSGRSALLRYDGEDWTSCFRDGSLDGKTTLANRADCGDFEDRLAALDMGSGVELSVASAGERVYLAGNRRPAGTDGILAFVQQTTVVGVVGPPVILYKDHGKDTGWQGGSGAYDPGFEDPNSAPGRVTSIAVAQRADGRYEGWAVGSFQPPDLLAACDPCMKRPLMRLDPERGEWSLWEPRDAALDLLGAKLDRFGSFPERQVTLPGVGSLPGRAYIAQRTANAPTQLLAFNPQRERWELAPQPGAAADFAEPKGYPTTLAADGRGGVWAGFWSEIDSNVPQGEANTYFYNYTTQPPREVFTEVAHPLAPNEKLTDLTGAPDGSVWVTTDRGTLYRKDRITGWEKVSVPGWDPGRVVTAPTPASAVAVGADGNGLAVGPGGRVAEIGPDSVRLDAAAGTVCALDAPEPPCGTSFDLQAAAISPEGAAMVGGEKLVLLWREPGGALRRIASPDGRPSASITAISMPSANEAWLTTDSGQLFAGTGDGSGAWRWTIENAIDVGGVDRLLTEDDDGEPMALRDIGVTAEGYGFAVGDKGTILARDPGEREGPSPWRRVDSGVTESLRSVALPLGSGHGAIVGGERGLVLTLVDGEWRLARPGDQLRPDNGDVTGVALLPGTAEGQVDAWAGVSPHPGEQDLRSGTSQLLHYTDAPEDPLLDPSASGPLPDVPAPREGELSFAAFGRSDCQSVATTNLYGCAPLQGGTDPEQTILARIRDELLTRSSEAGGPQFSIFTGDAYETGGGAGVEAVEQNSRLAGTAVEFGRGAAFLPHYTGGEKYRRFTEQVPDWLTDRGLPVFAPIGARDLSEAKQCATTTASYHCAENRDRARIGENLAWRQAMEAQPAPWGEGAPISSGELAFEPLGEEGLTVRSEDQEVEDPRGEATELDAGDEIEVEDPDGPNTLVPGATVQPSARLKSLDPVQVPTGGANTHYAAEIIRGDEAVARLVVVDTSAGSLTASDPIQQPLELEGGQAAWLERVLCIEGSATDTGQCTREPGQQAIVVSNTPTYSYGPTNPTENLADAAVFESILLRHRANVVVSGKLGWNGRYWATAPGVHEPCPGEGYVPDSQAPAAGTRVCGQGPAGAGDAGRAASDAQGAAAGALADAGGQGIVPFVVASGAGGRFDELAERSSATASDGLWRGYSIVRLDPSGDPRKTIVEQRPVFDWVGIQGRERALSARQRLRLRGVGREPLGAAAGVGFRLGGGRFDEISSPVITHRYDLLLADPEEPWKPCEESDAGCAKLAAGLDQRDITENPCAPYLCLPARVGTIDGQTGEVRAGDGNYPDTFAVAMLSVADHVATYPLVFKRSPSFVTKATLRTVGIPPTNNVPTPRPPGQPPIPEPPTIPQIEVPQIPPPPGIPPLSAAAPPELQPPAPPAPPPPSQQPAPLDLTVAPPGVSISTPTALIQPPTPPVNPAPPGGARREARQRQAAAQKGGADSDAEADSGRDAQSGGDLADGPASPGGLSMTRLDSAAPAAQRARHQPSFTTLARTDQPSAWSRGALYGGGIGLAAMALALAFTTLRPGPRRREPEVPAPARAQARTNRF